MKISDNALTVLVIIAIAVSTFGTWTVINYFYATPSTSTGLLTETGNLTLTVLAAVDISLPIDTVNLGSLFPDQTNNTLSGTGFRVQNDGSVKVNVSINATDLFSVTNPSVFYTFNTTDSVEFPSYNSGLSITTFTNMPSSPLLAIAFLNFTDSNDVARVDINVTVPSGESPGTKTSTVQFTAVQA